MKAQSLLRSKWSPYVGAGAALLLLATSGCEKRIVVDANFDAKGEWSATTDTSEVISAHYAGSGLAAVFGGSTRTISATIPSTTSKFQVPSYDKESRTIQVKNLRNFLNPDAFELNSQGEGTVVVSDDGGKDQAGYACNINTKQELFVQFSDTNTLDFHTTITLTMTHTSSINATNCVKFFQDKIAPGAKHDASLDGLVANGVLDPNQLDVLQTLSFTESGHATKDPANPA